MNLETVITSELSYQFQGSTLEIPDVKALHQLSAVEYSGSAGSDSAYT